MGKERPILFGGEMVRAILDGRKTQTRRVCKYRITGPNPPNKSTYDTYDGERWIGAFGAGGDKKGCSAARNSPYGVPGDRLWVRETWAYGCAEDSPAEDRLAIYKADLEGNDILLEDFLYKNLPKLAAEYKFNRWRPSIHMPRWASRINLEVTKVRVERVTDIDTPGDCYAEGIPSQGGNSSEGPTAMKMKFAELWDSINEKRGFGWYRNPWVWVVEFKSLAK